MLKYLFYIFMVYIMAAAISSNVYMDLTKTLWLDAYTYLAFVGAAFIYWLIVGVIGIVVYLNAKYLAKIILRIIKRR